MTAINKAKDGDTATVGQMPADTAALHRQHQEEEAQRLAQRRQEALLAVKNVKVKITSFKTGLFGGIKHAQLQLSNPTQLSFTYIVVQVNYYKDSGGLYKSENIYFNNVAPNSSPIQMAPDSDRGTKVTCRIADYDSPDIPEVTDSLRTSAPTEPLN